MSVDIVNHVICLSPTLADSDGPEFAAPRAPQMRRKLRCHEDCQRYCWWKKSCTSWDEESTIFYQVLYIQTVVVWDFWTINSMGDMGSFVFCMFQANSRANGLARATKSHAGDMEWLSFVCWQMLHSQLHPFSHRYAKICKNIIEYIQLVEKSSDSLHPLPWKFVSLSQWKYIYIYRNAPCTRHMEHHWLMAVFGAWTPGSKAPKWPTSFITGMAHHDDEMCQHNPKIIVWEPSGGAETVWLLQWTFRVWPVS